MPLFISAVSCPGYLALDRTWMHISYGCSGFDRSGTLLQWCCVAPLSVTHLCMRPPPFAPSVAPAGHSNQHKATRTAGSSARSHLEATKSQAWPTLSVGGNLGLGQLRRHPQHHRRHRALVAAQISCVRRAKNGHISLSSSSPQRS